MKNTKKTALVTGGAGFIGSHIVDALLEDGYSVKVIDNLSSGVKGRLNPGAEFFEKDLADFKDIAPVFKDTEYVFHAAAMPRAPYSVEHPIETNAANVDVTLNVLQSARVGGVKRVIYSASSSAYGDQESLPLKEEMQTKCLSPYGLQKYIGELYCQLFSRIYGLETVSLRYFNVYGPRLDPEGDYALVMGKFLRQKKEGKPLTIIGDGSQSRDFTHVKDTARANLLAMKSERVGKGEVINIGGGKSRTIKELAEIIGGPVEYLPPRVEPKHSLADITKARELIGWRPEVSFEEGIAELKEIFGI